MPDDNHYRRWSRPMLRRLLLQHRIAPGADVLVVGFAHGPLGQRLGEFGLRLREVDEVPAQVLAARRAYPELRIDHWRPGEPPPLAEDERFDLVLVREHSAIHLPAYDPRCTLWAADLLATLRPGGNLVLIDEYSAAGELHGHEPGCLETMLRGFEGSVRRVRFRQPLSEWPTWRSLLSSGRRGRREMVSLTTPDRRISRRNWRQQAIRLSATPSAACCLKSSSVPVIDVDHRAA